jgi:hypothetical protein
MFVNCILALDVLKNLSVSIQTNSVPKKLIRFGTSLKDGERIISFLLPSNAHLKTNPGSITQYR